MKIVGASILGQDNKIELVNNLIANGITWIHYDSMDGLFVPRKTLPAEQIEDIVAHTDMHVVDIHMMVNTPTQNIQRVKNIAEYMTFHYEAESIDRIRKIFKDYGQDNKIGLAINPKTNVEQIYEFIEDCSHVLVMSVIPGKGGQSFIPESIDKIKKLRKFIDDRGLKTFIQVDGGINNITGPQCIEAGASALVSGSYLINNLSPTIESTILGKK